MNTSNIAVKAPEKTPAAIRNDENTSNTSNTNEEVEPVETPEQRAQRILNNLDVSIKFALNLQN